jgi:hypothetical protein
VLLLVAGGCAVTAPAPDALPVEPPPAASPAPPCRLGEPYGDARPVALTEILRDPEQYFGSRIRVRGLAVFRVETSRLVEPTARRDAIAMNPFRLHAPAGSDLSACDLSLVDVDGHLERTHLHGQDGIVLVAESMATPTRAPGHGVPVLAPLPDAGVAP